MIGCGAPQIPTAIDLSSATAPATSATFRGLSPSSASLPPLVGAAVCVAASGAPRPPSDRGSRAQPKACTTRPDFPQLQVWKLRAATEPLRPLQPHWQYFCRPIGRRPLLHRAFRRNQQPADAGAVALICGKLVAQGCGAAGAFVAGVGSRWGALSRARSGCRLDGRSDRPPAAPPGLAHAPRRRLCAWLAPP